MVVMESEIPGIKPNRATPVRSANRESSCTLAGVMEDSISLFLFERRGEKYE